MLESGELPRCSRVHGLSTSCESCSRSWEVVPRQPMLQRCVAFTTDPGPRGPMSPQGGYVPFFIQAGCSQDFPVNFFKAVWKAWVSRHWVCANCLVSPWFSVHLAMIEALLGAMHDKRIFPVQVPIVVCLCYAFVQICRIDITYVRRLNQTRIPRLIF